MKKHPEQKVGERLLGNLTKEQYAKVGWKTKRMGKIAYYKYLKSKPIGQSGNNKIYPVFVQIKEMEEAGVSKL